MTAAKTDIWAIDNGRPSEDDIGWESSIVLFLFAFVFRMIYILQSSDNPLFGVPLIDAKVYAEWADRMVEGIWRWDHVGNYLPVYPAFLALQQIAFGSGPLVNKVIQALMGSLSAVLMAQAAARSWNRQVGLLAGYLLAVYWMLVVFEAEEFAESFSIFFQSLTLWLLIRFSSPRIYVIAAGFAFALSAGARANQFLVLPFVLWWLIRQHRPGFSAGLQRALLFCIGTIVIISPIIYRNYQISGVPLLRSQGTWSLYSGLAPEFKGLHPPVGILFDKYMHQPFQAGCRTEKEIERYWGKKLVETMREEPLAVAVNLIRRLAIFFNAREWSQEFDVSAYRAYSWFLSLPWAGFWLIGPLGCLGFVLLRKVSTNQLLLAGYTVLGFASIIPFKASDRYRLPTAVLLTLFAAAAAWQLWRFWRSGEKRRLVRSLFALGIFGLVCWPDWTHLEGRKIARHDFHIALLAASSGHFDEALHHFKSSMDNFPWDADSPYNIGRILIQRGQKEQGLKFLNEALRREPHFPEAMIAIARVELGEGRLAAAERRTRNSLRYNPTEKDALLLLADIRRQQGNQAEEISLLKQAVLETKHAPTAMLVADRLADMGHYGDAVHLYRLVSESSDTERYLRVQAAMKAGFTASRFMPDDVDIREYWKAVARDYDDFTFFSLQAGFLSGSIDGESFERQMNRNAEWKTAGAYAIGLKHWLNGNKTAARVAFERCLRFGGKKTARPESIPQKWAWEDLNRLRFLR
ncbi:MAG: tetratricopeptide repeat protein [Desulfobacterales bacterium]